ncbi:neural cell adhesion molecule 1-like [Ptychodera flava]|uniref:neural cell adhesion molecule 1-like n=1 Tax=Ptychodera flava TaxID=63121 RepID=UPI00396A4267
MQPDERRYCVALKNGSMVSSANITLTEVSRDDAGQYVCNGYNIYYDGEQGSGSDTTILDVQYLPKVFLQSMPMRVREEAPVTLNCTIDSNPPADSHNWTLNGDVISSELIHTIDQTDRSDAGLYNCTAVNTFYDGEKGMGYNTTELVVEYVANVDIDGLETAVVDGTKTTITCTVTDGIPDPHSITLYHVWSNGTENEVDTVENMEGLNNHTFDLQIIRHWNNGSFYCAASTLFHDESVDFGTSTSIQMIVHYKPIITNPPTEVVTRNQGDSVNLKCSVDASPTFNVTWTKGNDELNPGEDSTTLHIANAKESDEGVYKCTAANYLGFDSHEITLTIVAPATPTPSGSQDPDIPLIAGISAGILALLIVIIVLAVMINRQKKPTSKTKNEAEMSVLDQQQTSPVLDAYVNPDNNMNESDGTNEKRNSNMYTEGPMSTFKTGNEENNIGRTEDDDVDDIAALYAQPLGKSSRQGNESKTRNSMPFDAEPGEYDPPAEPPRMYNKDKNVEGITYADLGFAPDSGRGAPGKPPEDTTEYARVDFSKMA